MISPYVRRHRLARELRQLREAAGLTHAQLADRIGQELPAGATAVVEGSGKGMLDDVNRMGRNPFVVY